MPEVLNNELLNEEVVKKTDTSEQALLQMLAGAWVTQIVSAATALGIPDALEIHHTRTSRQLAVDTAANPDALHRLMRALASVGVVSEGNAGHYTLTPVGDRLRASHPQSMRHFFLAETDRVHRRSWEALADAVRTGQPQPLPVFGKSVFDYYQEHPQEGEQFGRAMQNVSTMSAQGVLANYDFTQARAIVDIGGGNGSFVRAPAASSSTSPTWRARPSPAFRATGSPTAAAPRRATSSTLSRQAPTSTCSASSFTTGMTISRAGSST
jgi:hypothetical protein